MVQTVVKDGAEALRRTPSRTVSSSEVFGESETTFRHLLEQYPDPILVESAGVIVFANDACADLLGGGSPKELIGRAHVDLACTEQRDFLVQQIQAASAQAGSTLRAQVGFRGVDGSAIPVDAALRLVTFKGKPAVQVAFRPVNLAERKRAEEPFYKAFNAMPEPMTIALASDGRYIDVNESFLRVTGYRREEVIGRTSLEIKFWEHPEDREKLMAQFQRSGTVHDLEITFLTKAGERRTGLDSADIIELGGRQCILAIFKDITERKLLEGQRLQTEAALARHAEELARSNAELEQFAYVASHDLQEPLRMVASYTQLLAKRYKDKLDDDARDFIEFAVDGATRMQALITDLLNYSRVGTRGKPFKPVDCEEVLNSVLRSLQIAVAESGAQITRDPLPTVSGDQTQIGQLLQNLISNAVKFRNAQDPQVHVSAEREPHGWKFVVRDNGIGIAPEYYDRIFMIFQRLHSKDEYPGTGIGLAVCKKIVERHGGRIWVESKPGPGTTFLFTIPDREPSAPEEKK